MIIVMKKLLLICIILLALPKFVLANVGDIYYCETKFSRGVDKDTNKQWVEKNYVKEKFSFKLTEDKVIFNKQKENSWVGHELPVDILFTLYDQFSASNGTSILTYIKGDFFHVKNLGSDFGISYTYAVCEIF